MNNKVSLKQDILVSTMLIYFIEDEEYPVDVLVCNYLFSKNTSRLKKISKQEIEHFFNMIIKHFYKFSAKSNMRFGTVSIEVETFDKGNHEVNFRVLVAGNDLLKFRKKLQENLQGSISDIYGGEIWVEYHNRDKLGLQLDIIPIQMDLESFIQMTEKNKADSNWYTEDISKFITNGIKIITKADLNDPLYKFEIIHNSYN